MTQVPSRTMSKVVRIYDPKRNPTEWNQLLNASQVAVFVEDGDRELPLGGSEPTCEIFDDLSHAQIHCQKLIEQNSKLRCLVFDRNGRGGNPLATYEGPKLGGRELPFRVQFRPGLPLYEQVVYAATKAMLSGRMRLGDPFPSVRALSRELKINPNTAHKVVTQLITAGLIESRPGTGTQVAALPQSSAAERTELLGAQIEQIVVEAKRLGISLDD